MRPDKSTHSPVIFARKHGLTWLQYIAYRKGQNDLELVSITNDNSMFKAQARYLLERADSELWAFVLSPNNIHRRSVVDQVISTAVPESTEPDKVSVAVASFLAADLPVELIELLEKIVLEPSLFSDNENLQVCVSPSLNRPVLIRE